MKHRIRITWGALLFLSGTFALLIPAEAHAQRQRDFLFREPHVSLAFNMGYGVPRRGSEIYDFVTDELTVDGSDFNSLVVGGGVGIRILPRVELALEMSYSNSNTASEFREFVGSDDLPIEQNTKLSLIPLTASVKYYFKDRGRRVSRLAWVPGTWSPYVGVGGGKVFYNFKQVGEFVDYDTYDIFRDDFRSSGDARTLHVLAGVEYSIHPAFYITGEGRYAWAEANMDSDFVGFEPIDLSGLQLTAGLAVRF